MRIFVSIFVSFVFLCSQLSNAATVFESGVTIASGELDTYGGMSISGRVDKIDWAVNPQDWGWENVGYVWRTGSTKPLVFQFSYDGDYREAELYVDHIAIRAEKNGPLSSMLLKINNTKVDLANKLETSSRHKIGGNFGEVSKYLKKGLNKIEISSANPEVKHVVQSISIRFYD